MCPCARAVRWVEVGLVVLILPLPLFLCLLRFWDDRADKQQTMDTCHRPTGKSISCCCFPKRSFARRGLISLKNPEIQYNKLGVLNEAPSLMGQRSCDNVEPSANACVLDFEVCRASPALHGPLMPALPSNQRRSWSVG